MKVYKYRSAGEYFKRDLKSISENYFYAPNAEKLNDPCETLVLSERIKNQTNIFGKLFRKKSKENLTNLHTKLDDFISTKENVGIYSLSKSFNDELLWAHYANNHQGFCIEYDFEILTDKNSFYNFYPFDVEYSSHPPEIEISDISSKHQNIFKKIAGTKSKKWSYEQEKRILTDKYGEHEYNYSAVKAIYFGLRMPEKQKIKMMEILAGREIKYFQIKLTENSYIFTREKYPDLFKDSKKYLFELYRKNKEIVKYSIHEISYGTPYKKGMLSIVLDSKITKQELTKLGENLRKKLFRSAGRIFIFYYLKNDLNKSFAWGVTNYHESEKTISINGLTIEEEKVLIERIKIDKRKVIGHWIDESNSKSLYTVYEKDGSVFMETFYTEKSIITKEQVVTKNDSGIKYQDIDDKHNEYIVIAKNGVLNYCSEDGIFNIIEKTTYNTVYN
jgi:hypothetical protein